MNKIFKAFFNKRKKCYVVTSEYSSVTHKGSAKSIALIIPIIALISPFQPAYSVTFGGYVNNANGVFKDADGNKLLDLRKLDVDNGPTVGKGSMGAGQDAVSFGSGRFWEPLGDLSDTKIFFLNDANKKFQVYRGQGAYEGYVWVRGRYNEVSKDNSGTTTIKTRYAEYTMCWGQGKCVPGYENIQTKDLTFDKLQEIFTTHDPNNEYTDETKTYNTVDTRKLVNVSAGEISATSTDAVNGSQLYELDQKINAGASLPYLSVNATDDIADPQTSAKAQGVHSLAVGENAVAAGSLSLAIGTNSQIKEGVTNAVALGANSAVLQSDILETDTNGVVSVGSSSSDTGFNRRIVNVANGVNDHDAATVGQLKSETSGFAKLDGSNINVDNGKWLTALGSTSANPIAKGNKHFVTGEQIAEETRVVVGKYITGGTTTVAQNLYNLDEAIETVVQTKASKNELKDAFDFERNTTNANKVQNQARKAVTVASNDSLLQVSAGYGDTAGHYSLQLVKGSIADGTAGAGLVTGKTVFDYANQNLAAIDGSNIDPDNGQWLTKLGSVNGSAVSSGNTHFVSGAQVAAETRVGAKGNYILSENSAAANLQALDKGLGSVADAVGDKVNKSEVKDLVKVTNGSHTQVTSDDTPDGGVEYKVDVVADGLVADGNAGLVTGGAVKTAITNDIKAAFDFTTNTGNAHAVRDEARKAVTVSSANSTLLGVTAEADEAYHTTNYKLDVKTGAVSAANEALVTGKTVHDYIAGEKLVHLGSPWNAALTFKKKYRSSRKP